MSERIKQINGLLQEKLSFLFSKDLEFKQGVIVTIVEIKTAKDLSHTRVFVSVLPQGESAGAMDYLKRNASFLWKELAKSIVLKKVPRLIFLPFQEREEARVENLLENL